MKILVPAIVVLALATAGAQSGKPRLGFFKPGQMTLSDQAIAGFAAGDLNADGLPDLVAGAPLSGMVHVALGAGAGSFTAPVTYSIGAGRGHVGLADVDRDGDLDIVAAGAGIVTLLGNGDGTFAAPLVSPGSATDLVLADFNGDGAVDLASVGRNSTSTIPKTVDVYPGTGTGTFGAPITLFTSDNDPGALAAADLNGDGRIDLVFGVRNTRLLQVYLNGGDLTFVGYGGAFINVGPSRTVTGDVDGNGTTDIVTGDFIGTVSWFPGNGDGTLGAARSFNIGTIDCATGGCATTQWVELVDMNGDGALDVVTANQQPGSASVLLNDGSGGFGPPSVLNVLTYATAIAAGDYDRDGAADLAVVSSEAPFLDSGARVASIFINKAPPGRR